MFYGSFGTKNSMVTFTFKFDTRKGQPQVQLGQKKVKFQNSKLFFKENIPIFCSFVSGFQKCHIFLCTTIIRAKNCVSKMWRHHLYLVFGPLHSQRQWYYFEILYACCLYVSQSHDSGVWINWKKINFIGNNFVRNWSFEFWGSK